MYIWIMKITKVCEVFGPKGKSNSKSQSFGTNGISVCLSDMFLLTDYLFYLIAWRRMLLIQMLFDFHILKNAKNLLIDKCVLLFSPLLGSF